LFYFPVTFGKTTVTRSSKEAFLTTKDELTTKTIMEKVDEALQGKITLYKEEVRRKKIIIYLITSLCTIYLLKM